MIQIPFTKLHDQYVESKADIDSAIQKILDTTEFIAGPTVAKFEQAWANETASPSCAAVGSGTFALVLSLMACGEQQDMKLLQHHTHLLPLPKL